MKRFLATLVATMMVVGAMATTAFAADKTLVLSANKTELSAGDNIKILATLTETTEDVGALQFSITFDNDIFELASDDMSSISAPPAVLNGLVKYVPVEYHNDYQFKEYASYYQFASRQIGSELREEGMTVTFAYAGGVPEYCGLENKILGGAFLKVKEGATAGKTTIKLTSTACTYQGSAHNLITNEIPVTIKGNEPTTETKYFAASFAPGAKSAANNAIKFFFEDGDKKGDTTVYYGDASIENLESVVTAVEVTEVPEKSALTLVDTAWTTIVK